MRLLLDTHVFLWYITGSNRLSLRFYESIRDPQNDIYLSVVSLWEIIIKYNVGKLPLPATPEIYLPTERLRHDIKNLDLTERNIKRVAGLPSLHHDPFDRALIAQALSENMTIVTVDSAITQYPVSVL